jgi:uncharacterized protein YfkK (UPF0435 family)
MISLNPRKLNMLNQQSLENEDFSEEDTEYDEYDDLIRLYSDHEEGS